VNRRTVISLANLVAIITAFVVLFELPQYYEYAFYGLLAWILVGFVLFYGSRSGRSTPKPEGAIPSGGAASALPSGPLPSGTPAGASVPLDFCIFCGNNLPVGTAVCPACGHRVAPS
jgi:hypothetical protein